MGDLKLYAKEQNQLGSLFHKVQIFSLNIAIELGIEKCGRRPVMKRERYQITECMPIEWEIKDSGIKNGCKYPEILKIGGVKGHKMKNRTLKEYRQWVPKSWCKNWVKYIILQLLTLEFIALIRYSADAVHWQKDELQKLKRNWRKLLTINMAYHPQRLYVKRKRGR